MLLDASSEEGRIRNRFLVEFTDMEKKPDSLLSNVRAVMNTMHDRLLLKRADRIQKMFLVRQVLIEVVDWLG